MMRKLLLAASFGVLPLCAFAADQLAWMCTYQPADAAAGEFQIIERFVEQGPSLLEGGIDDCSGRSRFYEIVENTQDGMIAIWHDASLPEGQDQYDLSLVTGLLNKRTGEFRMYGYLVRTAYVDFWRGTCVRAQG